MRQTGVDRTTWAKLMGPALGVIDSLRGAGYGDLDFRLGGGTVLMFAFDHRLSRDIDIFFDDARALAFLSPRLNDVSASMAVDYQEQANSLKLVLPDGDIDFIVAGTVTTAEIGRRMDFEGRSIPLDPVAEILAKKLLYRAASFKLRDLFDLAVALDRDPVSALRALAATTGAHDVLLRRLATLGKDAPTWPEDVIMLGDPPGELAAAISAVGRAVDGARPRARHTTP